MSNPNSRLSQFRSYSYYHVLAVCDSSAAADALSEQTDLGVWEHATPDTRKEVKSKKAGNLGKYAPKEIPSVGSYCILINGSTDASYVIDTVKLTTATGAAAAPNDRSTSIAVEGSMSISEPRGIAFLDQIIKCCLALGIDGSQAYYVLKTFFVGHAVDDDGNEFVEHITDIPPVVFLTIDVTGSFTERGGVYEMLFVGAGHGAARMPQYSKSATSINLTAGDTLEQTLIRLQDNINSNYDHYFNCVKEQIQAASTDQEFLKSLRRVKYVIEVGQHYKDGGQVKYEVTNQPQQYKNNAGCNENAQLSFPAHTSIETAIATIMGMCPQVQRDMATGDSSSRVKYEYKIHTTVASKPVGSDLTELEYTVYYKVERFMVPRSAGFDPLFQLIAQDKPLPEGDPRAEAIQRNMIEFDYLYTGKNIDILEFDMKVNLGMAYLQIATLANTFKPRYDRAPNKVTQVSQSDLNAFAMRQGEIVQTPIFFGTHIKNPVLQNSINSTLAIQSGYTLSKHASLEVTDVTMKILGNDHLLGSISRTSSPSFVMGEQRPDDNRMFGNWSTSPAFAKVRVKMPRLNDDFALYSGAEAEDGNTDYATDFWFDGVYYIVGVDHSFESGEFTQTLHMLGIPKQSALTYSQENAEVSINDAVGGCYDNKIGIATTTPQVAAIPETPPSGDSSPTNQNDAATINSTAAAVEDVVGWNNATQEVKLAILNAAATYKVNAAVLAQFCAKESNFRPDAKAPGSSATGLFQFIDDTWNDLTVRGKIPNVTGINLNARLNPRHNANGAAVLMNENANVIGSRETGDLYLAHFLGAPRAKRVLDASRSGKGDMLLLTLFGEQSFRNIKNANPSIIRQNTTVKELITWAHVAMAKQLVKGAKPIKSTNVTPNPGTGAAPKTAAEASANATSSAAADVNPCGPSAPK